MGGPLFGRPWYRDNQTSHREAPVRAWLSLASASGFNRGYLYRVYDTKETAGYSEGLTGSENSVETVWASSMYKYEWKYRSLDDGPGLESSDETA